MTLTPSQQSALKKLISAHCRNLRWPSTSHRRIAGGYREARKASLYVLVRFGLATVDDDDLFTVSDDGLALFAEFARQETAVIDRCFP